MRSLCQIATVSARRRCRTLAVTPVAQPPGFRGKPEQRLDDDESDQFSIAETRREPDLRAPRPILRIVDQEIIGSHVQCVTRVSRSASMRASRLELGIQRRSWTPSSTTHSRHISNTP